MLKMSFHKSTCITGFNNGNLRRNQVTTPESNETHLASTSIHHQTEMKCVIIPKPLFIFRVGLNSTDVKSNKVFLIKRKTRKKHSPKCFSWQLTQKEVKLNENVQTVSRLVSLSPLVVWSGSVETLLCHSVVQIYYYSTTGSPDRCGDSRGSGSLGNGK